MQYFPSVPAKKCKAAPESQRMMAYAPEPIQVQNNALQSGQEDATTGANKPSSGKDLVMDETVTLQPDATLQVFSCPDASCAKPCVTFRAFKMHAKCVHKSTDMEPKMI